LLLIILLVCPLLSFAREVKCVGLNQTILIKADGSIDPPTAPILTLDNVSYVLTANITSEGCNGIVIERSNIIVDGAGYAIKEAGGEIGITLSGRSNVTIKNMEITAFYYGIELNSSSNCTISGNNIEENYGGSGIWLTSSSNNSISENNITNNWEGIELNYSSNCKISGNRVANNVIGIMLRYYSSNNTISGNNITANNSGGILFTYSSGNTLSSNNIVNNKYGISFGASSDNIVFHNNFLNNTIQAYLMISNNTWDDGYPSGGNYWSDYIDRYPNATEIDASGIGDTAYVIDANNTDRYPLMTKYIVSEFPSFLVLAIPMMATLLIAIVLRTRLRALLKPI
jgi:parallel beta-helix repeat protein